MGIVLAKILIGGVLFAVGTAGKIVDIEGNVGGFCGSDVGSDTFSYAKFAADVAGDVNS
jgi:hypothetical protein